MPRGSFDLEGSNFFKRPVETTRRAWQTDRQLLDDWHDRLLEAIRTFDPARLSDQVGDRFSYEALIDGAGAHDVYAGQIQLLKKLRE